ncbi:hypothetical protein EV359DRAFT_64676 [Lentinula novae-zelandiae]|nr:hypothetical protein EV359DRAFT_64676 [Lentinula novae-zelandiae]
MSPKTIVRLWCMWGTRVEIKSLTCISCFLRQGHRKKREAKIKRDVKRGIREPNDQDPFEIFVTVTDIRYTYYKESHKILSHTYGMLVLQDFEALTPNLLARTIETVEGGGLIVLLLKSMNSLRQLYIMGMDVHARYRTESSGEVKPRFNERFILSLAACPDCVFLDDELNVLPLSKGKDIEPLPEQNGKETTRSQENAELRELKNSLEGSVPAGPLVALAKTTDQARALLTFVNSLITPSDPSSSSNPSSSLSSALNTTTTLLAPRGRGKSSALGLAIAAAVHAGYANIFLTSFAPENLQTAWEFLFKGLDALGWEEHLDYDILQATHDLSSFGNGVDEAAESNPTLGKGDGGKKSIVRVNIFRNSTHRRTIQYIDPRDAHILGQAELLIIDEAAAIPLPVVRNLLGTAMTKGSASAGGNREKFEFEVDSAVEGQIELRATNEGPRSLFSALAHPTVCSLYHINCDTLFFFHPASEAFIERGMSLYVASQYKNHSNNHQLMSDVPGYELYVLLPHINTENKEDSASSICSDSSRFRGPYFTGICRLVSLTRISCRWLPDAMAHNAPISETKFAELSGARIVRVTVGKSVSGFNGEYFNLDQPEIENSAETNARDDVREAVDAVNDVV